MPVTPAVEEAFVDWETGASEAQGWGGGFLNTAQGFHFEVGDLIRDRFGDIGHQEIWMITKVDYSSCHTSLEDVPRLTARTPPIDSMKPNVTVFARQVEATPSALKNALNYWDVVLDTKDGYVPKIRNHEKKFIVTVLEQPQRHPHFFSKSGRLRREALYRCMRGIPFDVTRFQHVTHGKLSRFYAPLRTFTKNFQKSERKYSYLRRQIKNTDMKAVLKQHCDVQGNFDVLKLCKNTAALMNLECLRYLTINPDSGLWKWLEQFRDKFTNRIQWSRIPMLSWQKEIIRKNIARGAEQKRKRRLCNLRKCHENCRKRMKRDAQLESIFAESQEQYVSLLYRAPWNQPVIESTSNDFETQSAHFRKVLHKFSRTSEKQEQHLRYT